MAMKAAEWNLVKSPVALDSNGSHLCVHFISTCHLFLRQPLSLPLCLPHTHSQRMTDHHHVLQFIVSPLSWPVISPSFSSLPRVSLSHILVVLVLPNLLIDIRWHNRRQSYSSSEPLLSLIEWTERWKGAIDSAEREREWRKRDLVRVVELGQLHLLAWSDGVDGQMVWEEENVWIIKKWVDFLLLPQLIKEATYWVWQREEVSGRGIGIRREKRENRAKA